MRQALAAADLGGAVIVVRRSSVPSLLAALKVSDAVVIDVELQGAGSAEAIIHALELLPTSDLSS